MEMRLNTEEIANILQAAEREPYIAGKPGVTIPGDDPRFVTEIGTSIGPHRAVFSYTHGAHGIAYRHLSVSLASRAHLPIPDLVFRVAKAFGFTGWPVPAQANNIIPDDWTFGFADGVAILIQPIGKVPGAQLS